MTLNFPGPYQVFFKYDVGGFQHSLKLNLDVVGTPAGGTLFSNINVVSKDGTNPTLASAVDDVVNAVGPIYDAVQTSWFSAELWRIAPNSFDGTFVSAYATIDASSSLNPAVGASEVIMTFRTEEGGIMKLYLEESTQVAGVSIPPPYTGQKLDIQNAIMGPTRPWLGRDTSFPLAVLNWHPGQNEHIFKQRNR